MIHRMDPPAEPRDPYPDSVEPMLARSARLPRKEEGWATEVRWSGVRAIAFGRPGLLRELELDGDRWQTPKHSLGSARELLEASRKQGLDGLVLKRLDSRYEPGRRVDSWRSVE